MACLRCGAGALTSRPAFKFPDRRMFGIEGGLQWLVESTDGWYGPVRVSEEPVIARHVEDGEYAALVPVCEIADEWAITSIAEVWDGGVGTGKLDEDISDLWVVWAAVCCPTKLEVWVSIEFGSGIAVFLAAACWTANKLLTTGGVGFPCAQGPDIVLQLGCLKQDW